MTFHFIKHLFLENILYNPFILEAILNNQVHTIYDFEKMAKLEFTPKFNEVVEKLQIQLKSQQDAAQKEAEEKQAEYQKTLESYEAENVANPTRVEKVDINDVVLEAVQQLKNQYIDIFQKAKIYEIKNIVKLANRIQANSNGYI